MGSSNKMYAIYWVDKCFESQLGIQILEFTPISTL